MVSLGSGRISFNGITINPGANSRADSRMISMPRLSPGLRVILPTIRTSKPTEACCNRSSTLPQDLAGQHSIPTDSSSSQILSLPKGSSSRIMPFKLCNACAAGRPDTDANQGISKCVVNQNVEPSPREESASISPSMSSTSCLQIASPRPVPPYFRVVELSA